MDDAEEADDKTSELSELSELGLGAEVSTAPDETSHLVVVLFWKRLLDTRALVQ